MVLDKFTPIEKTKRFGDNYVKRAVYIRWVKQVYRSGTKHEGGSSDASNYENECGGLLRLLYTPWSAPIFLEKEGRQYCRFLFCASDSPFWMHYVHFHWHFCSLPSIFVNYSPHEEDSNACEELPLTRYIMPAPENLNEHFQPYLSFLGRLSQCTS